MNQELMRENVANLACLKSQRWPHCKAIDSPLLKATPLEQQAAAASANVQTSVSINSCVGTA
jgi:hypothetical protein